MCITHAFMHLINGYVKNKKQKKIFFVYFFVKIINGWAGKNKSSQK